MNRKTAEEIISIALIILFAYAGIAKLSTYSFTKAQIGEAAIFEPIAGFIAWFIPAVELGAAALLVFPATRRMGLIVSLVLMAAFTLYITGILLFSSHIPCACGGIIARLSWKQHLLFNFLFCIATYIALTIENTYRRQALA